MAGRLLGCGARPRKGPQSPPKKVDDSSDSSTGLPENLKQLTWKDLQYLARTKGSLLISSSELDKRTRLWIAAEISAFKEVEQGLQAGEIGVADKNPEGSKLIHVCAHTGSLAVVRRLLEMGDSADAVNDAGETPIFMASSGGHSAIVKHLLSVNADVNKPNIYHETPLYVASYQGHVEVVRALVEARGVSLSAANDEGVQAVDIARRYAPTSPQHKLIVQVLERSVAWSRARLVYIGFLKNKDNAECPLRLLSKEAVKKICEHIAKGAQPRAAQSPSPPRVDDFM